MGRIQLYTVKEAQPLSQFLLTTLAGAHMTRVKNLLGHRVVDVNDAVVVRGDTALSAGDRVRIRFDGSTSGVSELDAGLRVLHENEAFVVLDKPAGLLTVATETEKKRTAWSILQASMRRRDRREQVFVVHRLDRETSGLLLMARREAAQAQLQEHWDEVEKHYLAIVEGVVTPPSGTLRTWLRETPTLHVLSSPTPRSDARLAVTHYETLQHASPYTLLRLTLETGRKHRIRVHLATLGHPILGDNRYGGPRSPARRLALHATELTFPHPVTGVTQHFSSPLPPDLERLLTRLPG